MNLFRIGMKPQNLYDSTYIHVVHLMLKAHVLERFHCYTDILENNSFINTMNAIKALQMLDNILELYKQESDASEHIIIIPGGMFRRRYLQIYYLNCTTILNLTFVPLSVLKFLYNQIYNVQINSDKELLVSDIKMFNFEGI